MTDVTSSTARFSAAVQTGPSIQRHSIPTNRVAKPTQNYLSRFFDITRYLFAAVGFMIGTALMAWLFHGFH